MQLRRASRTSFETNAAPGSYDALIKVVISIVDVPVRELFRCLCHDITNCDAKLCLEIYPQTLQLRQGNILQGQQSTGTSRRGHCPAMLVQRDGILESRLLVCIGHASYTIMLEVVLIFASCLEISMADRP